MKQLLKSPLWPIVLLLLLGLFKLSEQGQFNDFLLFNSFAQEMHLIAVLLAFIWFTLVYFHNRKHPNNKIAIATLIPIEFREEDEGMKWITYEACRKVYIFFTFAFPAALFLIFLLPNFDALPLILLIALPVMQYTIFGAIIRRANSSAND